MIIRSVTAELFDRDRRTDRHDEGNSRCWQILRTRLKTSQLMLYREIIVVCSQIHTKHIDTLSGRNVELVNVKLAVYIVTTGL